MAEKDDAVRQFEEDASAFTQKVESLTTRLAEREADYQVCARLPDIYLKIIVTNVADGCDLVGYLNQIHLHNSV